MNIKIDKVLEYVKKHPGMSERRISNAFMKGRLFHSLNKLEGRGKITGVPTTPFKLKPVKIYFYKEPEIENRFRRRKVS